MLLLDTHNEYNMRRQTFGVWTHFDELITGDKFTVITENSGAAAIIDGHGGLATLVTGATDNDETYVKSTKELFLFQQNKPLHAACRLKFSEASGTAANVAFGFMSAVAADSIVDGGATLQSSYSGAMFFKSDGGTLWNCETSLGTTRTGTTLLSAANSLDKIAHTAPGTVLQWLEIEVLPETSTEALALFYIDGICAKSTRFTYTSATEMNLCLLAKTGSGNALTITADFLGAQGKL